MTEGLDLYDDVLTTSGPVEDEALQTHVCIRDFEKFYSSGPSGVKKWIMLSTGKITIQ